ncbi:MAG: zf-HC2 domain-containing protein [Acidobacteria bacterium]|nr:zf-HC2 domain-containing protein [Acidobacteriota bacterium]
MDVLTCAAIRGRLAAFHDGELPVGEQIEIETHVEFCSACAHELRGLGAIAGALRAAAASFPRTAEVTAGVRAGVLSRIKAERYESIPSKVQRMFEDLHLVWAALGATASTGASLVLMFFIMYFASPERTDSLAALLQTLASPARETPVTVEQVRLPRVYDDALMPAMLINPVPGSADAEVALAAVVTSEGHLVDIEVLLARQHDRAEVAELLDAVSATRFEPGRVAGSPIAMNMVWLLAQTTVRPKLRSS